MQSLPGQDRGVGRPRGVIDVGLHKGIVGLARVGRHAAQTQQRDGALTKGRCPPYDPTVMLEELILAAQNNVRRAVFEGDSKS